MKFSAIAAAVRARFQVGPPALTVGSYLMLGALSFAALSTGDFVAGLARLDVTTVAAAVGSGIGAGLVAMLPVALSFRLLSAAGWRWAVPLWIGVGAYLSTRLILDLGVLESWSGPHARLARIALAAGSALGLAVALLALAAHPHVRHPRGWLAGLGRWWRLGAATGLVLCLGVVLGVDRYFFALSYPAAHDALRWLSWLVLDLLLLLIWPQRRLGTERWWPRLALGLVAVTLCVVPFVKLAIGRRADLHALLRRPLTGLSISFLRDLTDLDRDGYSSLLGGGDCAAFDPGVNPGADEIPGNGVDENCLAGDGRGLTAADAKEVPVPTAPSPLSVILITVDTLRADRMGAYNYDRDTTPRIDAWGKKALRFERAYTAGPWTTLALSAMFRGAYPRRLQWTWVYETNRLRLLRPPFEGKLKKKETVKKAFVSPIGDTRQPLPWWLKRRGMVTSAVVDDGRSQFLAEEMNVSSGWDRYDVIDRNRRLPAGDRGVTQRAAQRLRQLASGAPFFLWVHYYGPHDVPKREHGTPRYGKGYSDGYDHVLSFTDAEVGKFLKVVEAVAADRPVAVILTADHGEAFLPDHRGHGATLWDRDIHIPMFIRGPGFVAGATPVVASLVDIMPTVLAWTETPGPDGLDGEPLQELLAVNPPKPRQIIAETWRFTRAHKPRTDLVGAIDDRHKLVWNLIDHSQSLSAIGEEEDGEEPENLIGAVDRPELEEAVARYLEQNRKIHVRK